MEFSSFDLITQYVSKVIKNGVSNNSKDTQLSDAFMFINDIEQYNEKLSSSAILGFTPVKNSSNTDNSLAKKAASPHNSKVNKSFDENSDSVFLFEMDENKPSTISVTSNPTSRRYSNNNSQPTPNSVNNDWKVIKNRRTSFQSESDSSRSIIKQQMMISTPSKERTMNSSNQNQNDFPSLGSWTTPTSNRRGSHTQKNMETPDIRESISFSTPNKQTPPPKPFAIPQYTSNISQAKGKTVSKSLSKSIETSFASLAIDENESDSVPITIKPKLSKKERKKLLEEQKLQEQERISKPLSETQTLSPVTFSNPWKIPSVTKPNSSTPSPFATYSKPNNTIINKPSSSKSSNISQLLKNESESSSTPKPTKANAKLPVTQNDQFGLEQIIHQEKIYSEIKTSQAKKSLKEIQEEEAFAKWWEEESARVQREEQEMIERAKLAIDGSSNKNFSNRNRKNRNKLKSNIPSGPAKKGQARSSQASTDVMYDTNGINTNVRPENHAHKKQNKNSLEMNSKTNSGDDQIKPNQKSTSEKTSRQQRHFRQTGNKGNSKKDQKSQK